jgi:sporulation protein YlmC with PRC-barrel domain
MVMTIPTCLGELSAPLGFEELRKLKVVDEAVTFVGVVQDLEIDLQDGCITQVEIHAGGGPASGARPERLPTRNCPASARR